MSKKKIGFIGLGNMGIPMSTHLLRHYEVYGYDINEKALQTFSKNGGNVCNAIADVCTNSEIIFISLPVPTVVESVYEDDGILQHATKNTLIIDTSTVSSELNDRLEKACTAQGLKYIGAPVSGGVIGAKNATLTFMVGGKKEYYEEALPLLQLLGGNIFHVGEQAFSGTVIKLINNLMIGFYTQAVGEALALGEEMGLDARNMHEILSVSYGQSRIYDRNYKEYIAENDFNPGFTVNLLLKDLKLAKQMAKECDVPLPIGTHLIDWYDEVANDGYGDKDMAAVYLKMKDLIE